MEKIAIIFTCYNRCDKTIRCLKSLNINKENKYITEIFMVDDGCTDGTAEKCISLFKNIHIIQGTGSLFWNRGMNMAFSYAVNEGFDYYLWINDDVDFYPQIVDKLLYSYKTINKKPCVLVGATCDKNGKFTYGPIKKKKSVIPLNLYKCDIGKQYKTCDTFNGNCVLIPDSIVKFVGINDAFYRHGFGDNDYGFMIKKAGFEIYSTNYYVGICESNDKQEEWLKKGLTLKQRYHVHNDIKHRPYRDWHYFCKKNGGIFWPLRCYLVYIKILFVHIKRL